MVDFQSRETRRSLSEETDDADGAEPADETERDAGDRAEAATDDDRSDAEPDAEDRVAVLATSGAETDVSDAAADALESAGYAVEGRERRARAHDAIQAAVDEYVDRTDVCAVVTVGGTGVGPDDRTVEAIRPLFTKVLPGFGEAFRRAWGDASDGPLLASRVTGGIAGDTPVFCLPGDAEATTFAARELVADEAAAIHRDATDA